MTAQAPLAPGLPLLGNALSLAGDIRGFLHQQYEDLGPVFRVKAPGYEATVLAGLDANLFMMRHAECFRSKEVWEEQDAIYGASRSVLSMDGPEHLRFRKALRRGYGRATLDTRMAEVVALSEPELTPGVFEAHYFMQRLVTKQLGLLTAHIDATDYLDDMIRFVRMTIAKVTGQRPGFTLLSPGYKRSKTRAFELGTKLIKLHSDGEHDDLIGDILQLHRDDPEFLPEDDMLIAVLGPFIAGLDTAASTLAFVLYNLYVHPEVLEQVQAEADGFFAGELDSSRLKEMTTTYKLVLETLRMYPISPALSRVANQTIEFGGYTIPEGEALIVATTVPHYLPEHFPDPHTFDLERYAEPRNEHRQTGAFVPFGLGAHTCLGMGLAEALMLLNVATLTHFADLSFPDDYQLSIDPVPTPKTKNFKVTLTVRA